MRRLALVFALGTAALNAFADNVTVSVARISEGQTVMVHYQEESHICFPGNSQTLRIEFGDGTFVSHGGTCSGDDSFTVSHVYTTNPPGNRYTILGIYSDSSGAQAITNVTFISVTNVAPAISALTGLVARTTVPWTNRVTFSDPGADSWSATVNYGDGSAPQLLNLGTNKSFQFSHTYSAKGAYSLDVAVSDGDDVSNQSAQVFVNAVTNEPAQLSIHTLPGIVIDGAVGASYDIQHSTLEDTNWTTSATLTLSNFVQLWVDSEVTNGAPKRFYRAVEQR